jgi:hypothetical protein
VFSLPLKCDHCTAQAAYHPYILGLFFVWIDSPQEHRAELDRLNAKYAQWKQDCPKEHRAMLSLKLKERKDTYDNGGGREKRKDKYDNGGEKDTLRLQGDANTELPGNEGRRMGEAYRLQGDANTELPGNGGSRQAPGAATKQRDSLREATENAAPTLARYGYTRSGVVAVAGGGKFRVLFSVWGKQFAFGRYEDIHVAMLVTNMIKVMVGRPEAVRRIRYGDWDLDRLEIEAKATRFVHKELEKKREQLNAQQKPKNGTAPIVLRVPAPVLCAGEAEEVEERPKKQPKREAASNQLVCSVVGDEGLDMDVVLPVCYTAGTEEDEDEGSESGDSEEGCEVEAEVEVEGQPKMEDDNAEYHDEQELMAVDNSDEANYDEQEQDQERLEELSLSHGPAAAVHPIDIMAWEGVEEQFGLMLDL